MSRITSDFLRIISIVAVVIIHTTSAGEHRFLHEHSFFSEAFLDVVLNQIARFAVPIFVILSGFGLTEKYRNQGNSSIPLREFYISRASKIAIPYVFWTIVILFLFNRFQWQAGIIESVVFNFKILLTYLFTKGADYHFYFFAIILECYLVFPLLYRFKSISLWFALLLILLAYSSPSHHLLAMFDIKKPSFPSSFLVYWCFYFYTGIMSSHMILSLRDRVLPFLRKGVVFILFLAICGIAFLLVLSEYIFHSYSQPDPGYFNHFGRYTVIFYSLCIWMLFLTLDPKIERILTKYAEIVPLISGLTFFVYIFHTNILRLLVLTPLRGHGTILALLTCIISLGLAYLCHTWIRWNIPRVILGIPPKSSQKSSSHQDSARR